MAESKLKIVLNIVTYAKRQKVKKEVLAELLYLTPCRPNQLITTDLLVLLKPLVEETNTYKLLQIISLN
ncbi:hypothetical protein BpHYR1_017682 [Brachionus plicatilis]|uniref:Uncharacterized protein n=1 Tax=Brachionus plicatilis TaxID=10195 RepID=A0A3M7RT43_BRAPC|nr:hypothetical protein BpHYR1_017682 [Brachionus plicatilis]